MIHGLKQVYEEVRKATEADIAYITKGSQQTQGGIHADTLFTLMASLIEEVGELARAVKIEDRIPTKKLDESSTYEAVDVYICGIMMYCAVGGKTDQISLVESLDQEKLDRQYRESLKGQDIFEKVGALSYTVSNLFAEIHHLLRNHENAKIRHEVFQEVEKLAKTDPMLSDKVGVMKTLESFMTRLAVSTRHCEDAALAVCNKAYEMYVLREGKSEDFSKIALEKLDKWKKNQQKHYQPSTKPDTSGPWDENDAGK